MLARVSNSLVAPLERLVIGSVAITERAIAAAGTDLTFVQWRVLMIVGSRADGVPVGEIAVMLGHQASASSRLIARLRARGVVSTEKDPADARVTRVRLTARGSALRARVLRLRRRDLATIGSELTLEDGQIEAIDELGRVMDGFA
jgi:DNA-binding MarR family transcriptional regulator